MQLHLMRLNGMILFVLAFSFDSFSILLILLNSFCYLGNIHQFKGDKI